MSACLWRAGQSPTRPEGFCGGFWAAAVADLHPVDDVTVTRPLIRALQGHVAVLAESMDDAPEARRHSVAVAWVYMSALVAWAEDHGLVDPWLREEAMELRAALDGEPDGMRLWLAHAFHSLAVHPATRCLVDPRWTPLWEATPSEDACRALVAWWANSAPSLAYAHAGPGPTSITGWLVGDLLQAVSDQRRKGNALVQTPWWVCDFILDTTLVAAADEFRDETLKTIDPTCGTGHFLSRKVEYLWELYTTGSVACRQAKAPGASGWTPVGPAEAIERIVAGVTGVELDPLTAAVARLRMVVAVGDLMHRAGLTDGPSRLDAIPDSVKPRIIVADSLLAGKISPEEYAELYPQHAAIYGLATASKPKPVGESGQLDLFGEVAALRPGGGGRG